MATVFWAPNAANISEQDTLTVAGTPAAGNTISAVINQISVTYTLVSGDTILTAAAGLQALLSASTAPPEFQELQWSVTNAVITGTAITPGTPFTLTASATGGGATLTHAVVVANSSQSDVFNAANWLRAGVYALPQNNDDMVIANSSVPLLWNLASLSAVTLNSFTRWQSFIGSIGLPENNPLGYVEYRPTYFKLAGSGTLTLSLGVGTSGSGPTRERYDLGANQAKLNVLASGAPADDYAIRFLGTNASNVVNVVGTSVGVAMLPGEVATVSSATVDGGGSLDLGVGVTFSGNLQVNNASSLLLCAPATISAVNGAQLTVQGVGLTYASINAYGGSTVTYNSDSTLSVLTLKSGSTFDKSGDVRPITLTSSSIEVDTCQILDPNDAITYTNATTVVGQCTSGPITFGTKRTSIKVT